MPMVTACPLKFVCDNPDGSEGRIVYPEGTVVFMVPPAEQGEQIAECRRIVNSERKRTGIDQRVVLLDGLYRTLPVTQLCFVKDPAGSDRP